MNVGHQITNEMLETLLQRLNEEYAQAHADLSNKVQAYFQGFERRDAAQLLRLQNGEITQDQYNQWRIGQMAIGARWEEMRDTIAEDLSNTNQIAASMMNGHNEEVYALNHNYGMYEVDQQSQMDISFTLYDRHTVERLLRDDPNLLPRARIDIPEDQRWNRQNLNSAVTQGILQGESIPRIARRLENVVGMNRTSAVRNARTMTTSAENAGRLDSYRECVEMGIPMKKAWVTTQDERTRESHAFMDGEQVAVDDTFSNGLMEPGDPAGEPAEVYNCRCTMVAVVAGADTSSLEARREYWDNDERFQEWLDKHEDYREQRQPAAPANQPTGYSQFQKPERPRRADFNGNETAFQAARDAYREQRAQYENQRDNYISSFMSSVPDNPDLAQVIEQNGFHVSGDLSSLDTRAVYAVAQRSADLLNEFPMVRDYMSTGYMGTFNLEYEGSSAASEYVASAARGFQFGNAFGSYEDLLRQNIDDVAEGARVSGSGEGINNLVDHEFGHNVFNTILYGGTDLDSFDAVRAHEIQDFVTSTLYGAEGMSEYATTNTQELFAEGFAAWHGGEQTAFAQGMGEILQRYGVIEQ